MARIPAGEQLGNVTARPQRFDEAVIPGGAYGGAVGNAVSNIANEARRQQQIEQRKAELTQEAADKAQGLQVLTKGRDALADLHDNTASGIMNGQIDKTKAGEEWQVRSKEAITSALEGVPATMRESVQFDLEHQASRFTRGIGKAVEQRDQQDVRSGINDTLEYTQRLYATDPKAAEALANETLKSLGPFSGMDPAQIQKAGQAWKESTRYTKGYSMVNEARRDNASLDKVATQLDSEEFNAMDPQRKAQLMTTIEGYKVANIQKAEAAARHAQAVEERRLHRAESEFNAASSIINTGKVLSDAYVQQVSAAVTGTPYELAFKESLKQAPEHAAFGMQPLAVQERILTQARANLNQNGTDPKTEKQIKQLETIRDQARKDYAEDPILAAQERGIIQSVAPLDTNSMAGLISTIGERTAQASIVQQQVGAPVSPLLKSEAESVGKILNALPVEQRSTAIAQLAMAVGPQQASALGNQMSPKDKGLGIALSLAGDKTTAGRYVSEIVLRGTQAIKDKAVKEDNRALVGVRTAVAAEIGDAYVDQALRERMIDAAVYAEYGLQAEGNGDPRNAANLVTGGIVERAGKKVPLPRGMKPAEFDKRISQVTSVDIAGQLTDGKVYVSGTAMDPAEFLNGVPTAALIHAGQGKYAVQTGAGIATNGNGRPLIIEVK
jgi:hypothetical protein